MALNSTTVDPKRVQSIADQIRAAWSPIQGVDRDAEDAKEASTTATAKKVPAREQTMVSLAELARNNQWTQQEIAKAAGVVVAEKTEAKTKKAISTFLGEARYAMSPSVRDFVPDFVKLRDDMWEEEETAHAIDKDTPRPLQHTFKRRYHFLMTLFRECATGNMLDEPDLVLAYAAANDPDLNAANMVKVIEKAFADITGVYKNFRVDEIKVAMEALHEVTEAVLKANAVATTVETTANVVRITPKVVPTTVAPTIESESEPAEGAYDIDATLDGMVA